MVLTANNSPGGSPSSPWLQERHKTPIPLPWPPWQTRPVPAQSEFSHVHVMLTQTDWASMQDLMETKSGGRLLTVLLVHIVHSSSRSVKVSHGAICGKRFSSLIYFLKVSHDSSVFCGQRQFSWVYQARQLRVSRKVQVWHCNFHHKWKKEQREL